MRLGILRNRTSWSVRLAQRVLGFTPGPPAVLHYRPAFFGRHYGALLRRWLRGSGRWTAGELELMAAFVSARNGCVF